MTSENLISSFHRPIFNVKAVGKAEQRVGFLGFGSSLDLDKTNQNS